MSVWMAAKTNRRELQRMEQEDCGGFVLDGFRSVNCHLEKLACGPSGPDSPRNLKQIQYRN